MDKVLIKVFTFHLCWQDENDRAGHTAKLNLRELRMQSFMYKAANTWGPPFQCSATGLCSTYQFISYNRVNFIVSTFYAWTGTYRDEAAPLFVGTTLAVFALASISAYGVWRLVEFIHFYIQSIVSLSFRPFGQQILQGEESAIWNHGIKSFNEWKMNSRLHFMKFSFSD